jgi:putative ABC transport system permease protein
MSLYMGAVSLGLVYAFLALGIYITFRVYDFPDVTVDGSLTTGAAVCAILLVKGWNPLAAMLIAVVAGMVAGSATALIHTKFKINGLLSGILVMTALYSINLHIMGRSNVPLLKERTVITMIEGLGLPLSRELLCLFFFVLLGAAFWLILVWFFKTDLGLAMRATGNNPVMVAAQGVSTDRMKILGISFANGLVAFSGALVAQYQGFADVGMGIGMLVFGLAAVIIGETIVGKRKMVWVLVGVILGSIVFRSLIAFALSVGLNPLDLKLITALFVLLAIIGPKIVEKAKGRAK